ncbi:MAG TPA: Rieske 2Fe-2S domain-containing protein [Burkholderiaceae bacterium]|nr:Rieske 2Fe-2S domain-containing protein [Burkholderiaceae bacterium]
MLSRADNEFLTQTDPGTPMGAYLRRFWIPCMVLHEVPPPDEPPVRLRLLGEDLIVFRDTEGRIGVLDEYCPHRLTSLFFGRNEEHGIRCVYHGWKFATDGRCLDLPNEPASSNFRNKIRATAYPARERGGLLWVYMGPADAMPEFPEFEWLDLPAAQLYASRWEQECNSIQAMEGELDAAHVSFLHRRVDGLDDNKQALTGAYFQEDTAPRWHVRDTEYGFVAASQRNVENNRSYWRLNQFLLPFYTMITGQPGNARMTRMWVPKDDTHCWVIAVNFRPDQPLMEPELRAWKNGENTHRRVVPGTTQPLETRANNYLIDRKKQKTETFTGIEGIRAQDAMATESGGAIVDRTKEHLGTSDIAIIAMRKRLMIEARALLEHGTVPPASRNGRLYRHRAHQVVMERDKSFDAVPEVMEAMRA